MSPDAWVQAGATVLAAILSIIGALIGALIGARVGGRMAMQAARETMMTSLDMARRERLQIQA